MNLDDVKKLTFKSYDDDRSGFQTALRMLKPFRNCKEGKSVPLAGIEQTLSKMVDKYDIRLQWITLMVSKDGGFSYSMTMLKDSKNEMAAMIMDGSIYGLFAKTLLQAFILVKEGKITVRRRR